MKCQSCDRELDMDTAVEVPSPEWIDVQAIPCLDCKKVTLLFPSISPAKSPFIAWARKYFGFDGA